MYSVVIHECYDANDLSVGLAHLFLYQVIANQIADRLGSILIADAGNAEIKGR